MIKRIAAFTLVELLVVIGIIALLVSILLPTLNRARQQAVSVQCLSNLRQCGQFLYIYANQNRGVFPPMFLNISEELPRNKGNVNTTMNGVTFKYPDVKGELSRIANPGSDPYNYLVSNKAYSPGGMKVFYCPANWFWDNDANSKNSHNPEDFMKAGGTGDGGITGMITYWYFADPDPFYPLYHYTQKFNADGSATSINYTKTLDSCFFDVNHNGDNRDEYVVHLGEKNMDTKVLMTDQSRQNGSGNAGSWAGYEFVHGSPNNFAQSWTNVLYSDGHALSKKARASSFNATHTQFTNPDPSPDEVQPRWRNGNASPTGGVELW